MSCDTKGISVRASGLGWGPKPSQFLIRDVSFAVEGGDRLAIVGPNGAGKTTLLRCLYRGVTPLEGRVEIDGHDIADLTPRQVARRVAVVLQEMPADFPFTVQDVVLMGRVPWREGLTGWTAQDRDEARHALEHLDLLSLASRQFSTLSGGEKQRVLVARALAQNPEIVILDEPTNHLDIRHQLEILALLATLRLTIVTTLHDINLAADFATHVALMQSGRMTAFGHPDEVLTDHAISGTFGVLAERQRMAGAGLSRFSFSLASS
ncbi:iron ABC transporter ATP-binding protein [Rhizobium sp. Root274]|uniref:ABC transporter ATP-binding protein n=1 Tax=unclassified Rhizobium TaxID=2613769 RepID=UPI000712FD75|nr:MULTISPECIES: ABC transporter ATP-binding protein [unclassified Rhizobium]KQW32144.1 iron ABC transporter ATP-binding protein [Rhizobium sp. Root1240]KRD33683.1 iron ABC transporter ATP-binding protein [Rhizobium sp. Root274]